MANTETGDAGSGIPDVPDISAAWFRGISAAVAEWPAWLHTVAGVGTDAVLVLFALAMALRWWAARARSAEAAARAVSAPVSVLLAYAASEAGKGVLEVDRPCRLMLGVPTIEACPAAGDWSFPSNHAAIAGAAAVALWWAAGRAAGAAAVVLALVAASSRVVVGAHFPHDVLAGLLLGGVVAGVAGPLLTRVIRPRVAAWRDRPGPLRPTR